MKKLVYIISYLLLLVSCAENPYITEDVYFDTENPTKSWVNGLKRQMALTMNTILTNTELVSDNYFNNYTLYSKVFDIPQI